MFAPMFASDVMLPRTLDLFVFNLFLQSLVKHK
jgi:hypothetical protein